MAASSMASQLGSWAHCRQMTDSYIRAISTTTETAKERDGLERAHSRALATFLFLSFSFSFFIICPSLFFSLVGASPLNRWNVQTLFLLLLLLSRHTSKTRLQLDGEEADWLTGRHAKRRTRLLIYWNSSPPPQIYIDRSMALVASSIDTRILYTASLGICIKYTL